MEKRVPGTEIHLNKQVHQCSEEELLNIQAKIEKHGVVCVKEQDLNADQMVQFLKKIGKPMDLPEGLSFNNQENPFITRIGNIKKDGTIEPNQQASLYWHSDGDITPAPDHFIYIMLHAKEIPVAGGKTGFLDMRTLYQEASPEVKKWLEEATIRVKIADIDDFAGFEDAKKMADVTHNVNQIHPLRGIPQYYLCAHQGIVTFKDGKQMKTPDVLKQVFQDKYVYQHQYTQGDLVIWDDIQIHHRSMGGFGNNRRLLFRGQVQVGNVSKLSNYVMKLLH